MADIIIGAPPATPVTPAFTLSYVSAQQTITAAGTLTLPHALGVKPKLVQASLVCLTAELGFTIGQEFAISFDYMDTNRGVSVIFDATNLVIRFGSSATTFISLNPTTGASGALTNANFAIVFRAFA